jgi:signal transduction histidine kinase
LLLGGVATVLLIGNLVVYSIISARLEVQYDQSLLAKARALVTLTKQDRDGVELDFADEFMPEFAAIDRPEYFQIWLEDGTLLERSKSLRADDLLRGQVAEEPRFVDMTLPDGRAGRRVEVAFLPQIEEKALRGVLPQQHALLTVARDREQLDAAQSEVRWSLLIIGALVLALTALVVRFAVGAGLRPLDTIRSQVEQLDAESLTARLRVARPPVELDAIIIQFNALLDRLEAAFHRERQFSADLAHELRTPLAELRSLAEVGMRWPDDKALVQDFFNDVLGAAMQMEQIVINLLALARCEKGLEAIEKTELDLVPLVDAAWQRVAPQARDRRLAFRSESPPSFRVYTAQVQWELILNNLFSNAVSHSPAGSTVTCTTVYDDFLRLSVANRAEHLGIDDLPRLFDRFWRKDPARTGGYHAGLGLTLVKAYAEQLELKIDVALEPEQVFRITLSGRVEKTEDFGSVAAALTSANLKLPLRGA